MTVDADGHGALEEERAFLLRSLADLEREYAAGDVDEADYRELKDGYTVRAARVLREVASVPPDVTADRRRRWRRRLAAGLVVAVSIGVVWWVLAASSAERLPGQQISGLDPRSERQVLLAQARDLQFEQPVAAADLYALVLEDEPDDAEALAYRGWTLALSTRSVDDGAVVVERLREAVESLARAIEVDPEYADPYCFLGIVQFRFLGEAESALPFVDRCLAAGPPADVRQLVEALRADVVATTGGIDGPLDSGE